MANYRRSYVFRLAADPVAYLWTGFGNLDTPPDAIDPDGARWLGAGEIISIPALKALINGSAERVRFTMSGVSPEVMRLASEDRESVKGAQVRLGYVEFDANWQIVGGIHWDWLGIADALIIETTNGDGTFLRSVHLSVASNDTLRSNPNLAFWTDADQRKRSATDRFCDQVANIVLTVTRRFGPQ